MLTGRPSPRRCCRVAGRLTVAGRISGGRRRLTAQEGAAHRRGARRRCGWPRGEPEQLVTGCVFAVAGVATGFGSPHDQPRALLTEEGPGSTATRAHADGCVGGDR
jgi:hypothetical protein